MTENADRTTHLPKWVCGNLKVVTTPNQDPQPCQMKPVRRETHEPPWAKQPPTKQNRPHHTPAKVGHRLNQKLLDEHMPNEPPLPNDNLPNEPLPNENPPNKDMPTTHPLWWDIA
ncbi:hypothetical protein BS47DRAFT_1365027 [Hydnum rufescens UP504]|uniref:Uncharacterized protein n=1 Tax=Hydnum rufescens UP504 TaxID=1448309 RepID=A0A9P6AQS5_9AGAM|nr:hypothetical protein BS47DRAFT_1365027 [Hydnum rufescens UP504]